MLAPDDRDAARLGVGDGGGKPYGRRRNPELNAGLVDWGNSSCSSNSGAGRARQSLVEWNARNARNEAMRK